MDSRKASAGIETESLLRQIASRYEPGEVAISFSGAEDVVLIDIAHRAGLPFEIFSLDTGRLHAETCEYLERVRKHYGIAIELLMPEPGAVTNLVREKGLFSFYRDGHSECCGVRKVEPLRRKLATLGAWITGQRKDQAATRVELPREQEDRAFSTADHRLVKFNPLADWTSRDVWAYIRDRDVPYNALHDQGFVSIGCQPCTRPTSPHQHERRGRWWWEDAAHKECGLHAQNTIKIVSQSVANEASQHLPVDDGKRVLFA